MCSRGQLPLPSVMGESLEMIGVFEELEGVIHIHLLVDFTDVVWEL